MIHPWQPWLCCNCAESMGGQSEDERSGMLPLSNLTLKFKLNSSLAQWFHWTSLPLHGICSCMKLPYAKSTQKEPIYFWMPTPPKETKHNKGQLYIYIIDIIETSVDPKQGSTEQPNSARSPKMLQPYWWLIPWNMPPGCRVRLEERYDCDQLIFIKVETWLKDFLKRNVCEMMWMWRMWMFQLFSNNIDTAVNVDFGSPWYSLWIGTGGYPNYPQLTISFPWAKGTTKHPQPSFSINRRISPPLKIIYPKISGASGSPIFWPTNTSQQKVEGFGRSTAALSILDLCEKHQQKRCPQPFNIFGFPS